MSIWDEPLTKDEYLRRLFEAKSERRRKDADLPFEEKIEVVLALQEGSPRLDWARSLQQHGRTRVSELAGGIGAWETAGLPLTSG